MAALSGKRDDEPLARINPADAHTILGKEARFSGTLTFEGAVRIDGRFEGEVITDDLLLVGPGADVRATLRVGTVVINGSVEGDIHATVSVVVKAPARLKGNVVAPTLVIEEGVTFDGSCLMSQDNAPLVAAPPPPLPPRSSSSDRRSDPSLDRPSSDSRLSESRSMEPRYSEPPPSEPRMRDARRREHRTLEPRAHDARLPGLPESHFPRASKLKP